ncbi:MAG: hypothetical protein ACOY0T_31725 [Myxococcota bacterium]
MVRNSAYSRLGALGLGLVLAACGGKDSSVDGPSFGQGGSTGKGGGFGGASTSGFGGNSASMGGATGSGNSSGNGSGNGSGSGGTQPKGFNGAPGSTGFKPLVPGCGPETAQSCTNTCETKGGSTSTVIRPPATLCFNGAEDPTPDDPMAIIEQVVEEINGKRIVHLRVTFDPNFVDNTYGANAVGWDHGAASGSGGAATGTDGKMMKAPKSGHTFGDLVGSDHVELLLTDGSSNTVMDFKLDYITAASGSGTCGYDNLGVSGGEGKMITGNASAVIAATSSLDRNLNACGYCLTTDSPPTDAKFTPNPSTPNWDYRVVYEVWIDEAAFGSTGFGQAYITFVHASPSKLSTNTVTVTPGGCPPTWDTPYCPPGQTGPNCMNTGTCPPNQQLYIQTEGQSFCTPIPFAGYPNMAPCPQGYMLDPSTEGRFCVPTK